MDGHPLAHSRHFPAGHRADGELLFHLADLEASHFFERAVEHFPRIRVPCLFASGTRDSLAGREALTEAVKAIKGPVTMHWLESADHGYRPRKSSGRTVDEVAAEVAEVSVQWVQSLAA